MCRNSIHTYVNVTTEKLYYYVFEHAFLHAHILSVCAKLLLNIISPYISFNKKNTVPETGLISRLPLCNVILNLHANSVLLFHIIEVIRFAKDVMSINFR